MVWQRTVNPSLFGASRFDPYHLHQIWSVSVHGRTRHCHCRRRGSLPLQTAKLLREVQVEPNGLISHLEGGALPPPATSFRILTANTKPFYWKKSKADPVVHALLVYWYYSCLVSIKT